MFFRTRTEISILFELQGGFVPNVFRTLSRRPDEMRAFVNYYDVVMGNRDGGWLLKFYFNCFSTCVTSYIALFNIEISLWDKLILVK